MLMEICNNDYQFGGLGFPNQKIDAIYENG